MQQASAVGWSVKLVCPSLLTIAGSDSTHMPGRIALAGSAQQNLPGNAQDCKHEQLSVVQQGPDALRPVNSMSKYCLHKNICLSTMPLCKFLSPESFSQHNCCTAGGQICRMHGYILIAINFQITKTCENS
eukprot:4543836-Pleurochrysis_carterae.AAC.1